MRIECLSEIPGFSEKQLVTFALFLAPFLQPPRSFMNGTGLDIHSLPANQGRQGYLIELLGDNLFQIGPGGTALDQISYCFK
jgi:hypothetical protein